jgi:hypothetical protein
MTTRSGPMPFDTKFDTIEEMMQAARDEVARGTDDGDFLGTSEGEELVVVADRRRIRCPLELFLGWFRTVVRRIEIGASGRLRFWFPTGPDEAA